MSEDAPQDSSAAVERADRPQAGPQPRGPNAWGAVALALVLASVAVMVAAMVTAGARFNSQIEDVYRGHGKLTEVIRRIDQDGDAAGWRAAIGWMMAAGLALAGVGAGSGVWGMLRRGRRRAAAVAAVIVGGFFLLCVLAAWLMLLAG